MNLGSVLPRSSDSAGPNPSKNTNNFANLGLKFSITDVSFSLFVIYCSSMIPKSVLLLSGDSAGPNP